MWSRLRLELRGDMARAARNSDKLRSKCAGQDFHFRATEEIEATRIARLIPFKQQERYLVIPDTR